MEIHLERKEEMLKERRWREEKQARDVKDGDKTREEKTHRGGQTRTDGPMKE